MTTDVCLTFDFDAMSLWLGTFGVSSPTPLSRGEYGARVGVSRVLDVLENNGVPATFFIPSHTIETFPEAARSIMGAGHEIAIHGHLHESPIKLTRDDEVAVLARAEAAVERLCGIRPVGYRSPSWDLSSSSIAILRERGYLYDSSMMADDYKPYRPREGDVVEPSGMLVFGRESNLVEFPVAWELDDFPYFHFLGKNGPGLRSADEVGKIWLAEFDWCVRNVADGVFTLTMHPEVIGRGPRIEMLNGLIGNMKSYPDVRFSRLGDLARALTAGLPARRAPDDRPDEMKPANARRRRR